MKTLALIIVAFLAAIPAVQAADQGPFISLSAGQSRSHIDPDMASDRNDRAFGALVGYRWSLNEELSLGVEGGYSDLGKATEHFDDEYVLTDVDGADHSVTWKEHRAYKAKAYQVGINGQWNVNDRWNLSAHYGWARYRTTFMIKSTGTFDDLSDTYVTNIKNSHDGQYFGLGVGFKVTEHVNLSVAADRYKPSYKDVPGDSASYALNVWSIRAEYLF